MTWRKTTVLYHMKLDIAEVGSSESEKCLPATGGLSAKEQ